MKLIVLLFGPKFLRREGRTEKREHCFLQQICKKKIQGVLLGLTSHFLVFQRQSRLICGGGEGKETETGDGKKIELLQ